MRPALTLTELGEPDYTHCAVSLGKAELSRLAELEVLRLTRYEIDPWWDWREVSSSRPNTLRFDNILYAVDPWLTRRVTIGDVLAESLAAFISQERS